MDSPECCAQRWDGTLAVGCAAFGCGRIVQAEVVCSLLNGQRCDVAVGMALSDAPLAGGSAVQHDVFVAEDTRAALGREAAMAVSVRQSRWLYVVGIPCRPPHRRCTLWRCARGSQRMAQCINIPDAAEELLSMLVSRCQLGYERIEREFSLTVQTLACPP